MELDDDNFEEKVLEEDVPVLVDFWGSWCTACQRMKPLIEDLEEKYGEKVKIGHMNIDKNPQVSGEFEIEETPSHLLFEDGEVVERKMGALAKKQLEGMIEDYLD